MLLLQDKFKFSPDREKGQLLQPMLPAMAVALRHSDNTKPIILAFFHHVQLDCLLITNTADVTMLMTRPTMVIRLGATHIGQNVTNQFQYLGRDSRLDWLDLSIVLLLIGECGILKCFLLTENTYLYLHGVFRIKNSNFGMLSWKPLIQNTYFCIVGSRMDEQEEEYLCSFSFRSSRSLRVEKWL